MLYIIVCKEKGQKGQLGREYLYEKQDALRLIEIFKRNTSRDMLYEIHGIELGTGGNDD